MIYKNVIATTVILLAVRKVYEPSSEMICLRAFIFIVSRDVRFPYQSKKVLLLV